MEYWPWWKGALALGAITVFFVFVVGRMLGVSGSWARIVYWRDERKRRQEASVFRANAAVMQNSLLAATLAEFGEQKTQQLLASRGVALPSQATTRAPANGTSWTVSLTFLAFMAVGGLLAATASSHWELRLDLGATHTRLFGSGWREWLTLLGGGALVGFGTQMAGGCTSGHGLSGVARLIPTSLIATAAFFASAVATSFLVEALVK